MELPYVRRPPGQPAWESLLFLRTLREAPGVVPGRPERGGGRAISPGEARQDEARRGDRALEEDPRHAGGLPPRHRAGLRHRRRRDGAVVAARPARSEEHTSELQSLMRISYAVFCLQNKTTQQTTSHTSTLNS